MSKKKLTIGSAVYDDFEGVFFTYQSLRINNLKLLDELDFLIIDNNPSSAEGKATAEYCEKASIRYIPFTERRSTAVRNEIFWQAKAPYAMSMDSHVLLEANTINRLLKFYEKNPETQNLYHGPMTYDCLKHPPTTHMDPVWRDNMFGTWGCDKRGNSPNKKPFEIPLHGLGLFTSKVSAWQGFHILFKGFGGEEGYIHKKFKKAGHATYCLPWLRWNHRFQRPHGVKYPLRIEERVSNYYLGHLELGEDPTQIKKHFAKTHPHVDCDALHNQMSKLLALYKTDPDLALEQRFPEEEKSKSLKVPTSAPEEGVETWDTSRVDFKYPGKARYVKFISLKSLDTISVLGGINIETANSPSSHQVIFANSQDPLHPASNILSRDMNSFWSSDPNDGIKHPHETIVDLGEVTDVKSIVSYRRQDGNNAGTIMHFKILTSQDKSSWTQVSEVQY